MLTCAASMDAPPSGTTPAPSLPSIIPTLSPPSTSIPEPSPPSVVDSGLSPPPVSTPTPPAVPASSPPPATPAAPPAPPADPPASSPPPQPPATPSAPPAPSPPPLTPATPTDSPPSSPPTQPPPAPADPPASTPPPQATPAAPPGPSPPPQSPATPVAPPPSFPAPQSPVTPAAPPLSSPPLQPPVTPAAPPASPPIPQPPIPSPPAPVAPTPSAPSPPPLETPPPSAPSPSPPLMPPPSPPVIPAPSTPTPSPPVIPAPSTPTPSPPATPAPSVPTPSPPATPAPKPTPSPPVTPAPLTPLPPSPAVPAPATPSPPSPVTPVTPTPTPPSPSTPEPPLPSPSSPSTPAPPMPSPPSPVTPVPPTPSQPSPSTPAPPLPSPPSPETPEPPRPFPPSPVTPRPPRPSPSPPGVPARTIPPSPPPTIPSPLRPDPPAAPTRPPSSPSVPPSPPGPAPPGVTPSPPSPSGAPHAPRSPPSLTPPAPSSPSPFLSPSPSTSNGTVIGVSVAIATVVVLGLMAGLIYFCSKKRRPSPPGNLYGPSLPVTSSHPKPSSAPLQAPPQAYSQQMRPSWQTSSDALSCPLRPPPPPPVTGGTVSYADLAAATGGFSDANLLGQGGFGHVYRGTLDGAREVAIKRLRPGSGQGDREFRAEVEIISRVHHRHLVSLVGYCIHGDQRLLVYEYVPNKTLELHLHGSERPMLDWPHRWKIALGSAKGLAYLHEDCDPKIIHRDIKAANILLDYNFEPKVSDFGLAKILPSDDTHVSTRVMGTFGYLAPEYATTGKVTDRSDVYSFGVVLLELITGRRPVLSSEPYNDETLVSWARPLLTKALEEEILDGLIDPNLGTNYDAVDMQRLIACAAGAVRHTARSRPRMSQIVRYLEGQLSMEALNAGVAPGQSELLEEHAGEQLRRMAFVPGTTGTYLTENMSSSYVSEPTSEYGLHPSSSSSGASDDADTGEVADAHRAASRPQTTGSSATGSADCTEGQSSGEVGAAEGTRRRVTLARKLIFASVWN